MFNWWVDFYAEIIQNKMKQKTLCVVELKDLWELWDLSSGNKKKK